MNIKLTQDNFNVYIYTHLWN